mmetsp:Transcript_21770/g.32567  ORF Transcript_21770/g.32567 Transcript_21770/m.32567 type:complete len:145 (-) Transcript_21770:156-590(-)
MFWSAPRRVFYETTFMVHHKFPANDCKLLFRETSRAITNKEGAVFRILDLGWRHTAQPVIKKNDPPLICHYGRWYVMSWGGPPVLVREMTDILRYSNGVLRFLTTKIRGPQDVYRPRTTFYPVLEPRDRIAPPLIHHTLMNEVR